MNKKIIIIGGGFAGLSAAKTFYDLKYNMDIIVLDKKRYNMFLPMLPDCIGRNINPDFLDFNINEYSKKYKFRFVNEEVTSIDLDKKDVLTTKSGFNYDYLVIACGCETNFYGNETFKKYAYKIDNTNDVKKLMNVLNNLKTEYYIISGGGYKGIEIATNLRKFLIKNKKEGEIIVVEKAGSILTGLPEWVKEYISGNLKKLNIKIFINSMIEKVEEDKVYISGNRCFNNAMLIWAAGVKTPDFIRRLNTEKNSEGRLKVDKYLRIKDDCFVIGDVGLFYYKNTFLRMAVPFAIAQGRYCAININRFIKSEKLIEYYPIDYGYIIPMANNKGCGTIFNVNIRGIISIFMHYFMCIYRTYGIKNKINLINFFMKGVN